MVTTMIQVATIYTLSGDIIATCLQTIDKSDVATQCAWDIARRRRKSVWLRDSDGDWLVGPRGGLRRLTEGLKRRYGFVIEGENS